jgi:hypothetical protein
MATSQGAFRKTCSIGFPYTERFLNERTEAPM